MLSPVRIILLGKLSIALNSNIIVESASAETAGISATIFPAISDESPENRDLRGYQAACRQIRFDFEQDEWTAADSTDGNQPTVLMGRMGAVRSSLMVIPGKFWHTIIAAADPVYQRNDLAVIKKEINDVSVAASHPYGANSYALGETNIANSERDSNDYFAGGMRVQLALGTLLIKVTSTKSDEVPIASNIPKLKTDLGQNLFSLSGWLRSVVVKTISCKAVKYTDISGLETVSSIRLGDGKGSDAIIGLYKVDTPGGNTINIEAEMMVDRGLSGEGYLQFQDVIRGIRSLKPTR